MNPDLLDCFCARDRRPVAGIYAGRKRLAIGQWLGLGALILGTVLLASATLRSTLDSKSPMQFLED